jgi:Clostripain family
MLLILGGVAVVCIICFLVYTCFQGPQPSSEVGVGLPSPTAELPEYYASPTPVAVEPTKTTVSPQPFTPPPVSSVGQTWLVMLYQDADDKILEQDIDVDLNEAERAGSDDRVKIVSQMDRYLAGFQGDGNWTTTKRFNVTQDNDLSRLHSQELADIGEANMADGATLVDFVTWAMGTFPADKYVLILSDHGMGWPGGWSDPDPGGRGDPNIPLSSVAGNQMYLNELDRALGDIVSQTGLDKFELIGLDACLMGHLEVMSSLAPYARYAVLSQETEPSLGWAYTAFLDALKQNPDMDGAELGRQIVQSYIQDDQRIVDDQARAEFVGRGSPMSSLFGSFSGPTAEELAQQMEQSSTLTAVDLAAVPAVIDTLNDLSYALSEIDQRSVAQARTYAQSFTSVFGSSVPPSYIDLASFVELLKKEGGSTDLDQAADRVLAALNQSVIAEKHGSKKPGAHGVSLYFPNSELYRSPITGPQSYTAVARRFADESLWDDFLAFHYTGRAFEPDTNEVVVPERGATVTGPGSGGIQVSPITLSSDVAAPGMPVLLSTDIQGQNVGYVYLFVGYLDAQANSIFVADMDYLESADTREIDGVYYPDWGDGTPFTMEFEWEPLMFAIDDGANSVVAALTPRTYGASPEEAVYTVDGIYTYADGGESRHARLYFSNGVLTQVYGFTGEGATGAPREITPNPGDTFTVLQKWMDLDQSGKVSQTVTQEGDTLTFGDQMFTWKELDAAAGTYIVGFIVEDLDGKSTEVYEQVTVQ